MKHAPFAKKSLGQHFLVERRAIESIVNLIPEGTPLLLEIGPGRGALSGALAERAERFCALEKDDALYSSLVSELKAVKPGAVVWHGDALEFDWERIWSETGTPASTPLAVAANLPYNVATEIFFRLLALSKRIPLMALMFQKEVGARFAAEAGGSEYGIISVLAQNEYEVTRELVLKPGTFAPPPKVDSLVVAFRRRAKPLVELSESERPLFSALVKAAFAHRRKTLENSLSFALSRPLALPPLDKKGLGETLQSAKIDGKRRAQTLSVEEFGSLLRSWLAYGKER